jgi:ATP-dependent Clp protease protease subunit
MQTNILLKHRILFLSGPVNNQMADRVIASLLLLDAEDPTSPIDLYINSPGGSLIDGMAIIDTMQCLRAPIRTLCVGQAASTAACLLACGAKDHRFSAPNAEIMIHQVEAGIEGSAVDMQLQAQRVIRLQENLIAMLADWTGKPKESIRKDLDRESFMTARQAVDYGLVDHILEPYPMAEKAALLANQEESQYEQ